MESKIPEWFLSFYESLFLAQLRTVRQLKSPKPKRAKGREDKGMSNMDIVIDILRRAPKPLHISEIITQAKTKYGVTLDRESLVSALVKKVHRHQGLSRTAPNTFQIETEGK
jgi:predicted transcriptional regulator